MGGSCSKDDGGASVKQTQQNQPMADLNITLVGWSTCTWFQRAVTVGKGLELLYPSKFSITVNEKVDKPAFQAWLADEKPGLGLDGGDTHKSSPFVYFNDTNKFLGGFDVFAGFCRDRMGTGKAPASESKAVSDSAEIGEAKYDYNVLVIGGGSGGMAFSKAAANLGAKTALLDFIKPTSVGTTWGLGGTCVNVGCIPKKLYHRAAVMGEVMKHDATGFGWAVQQKHDWATLTTNIRKYINGLNKSSEGDLRSNKVEYLNMLGEIVDKHTVKCTDGAGVSKTVTAARIVIAVGGRPTALACEGGELAIDSDDLFQMDWAGKTPGKVLVIGASYVALECAGFLNALDYDTTVMVRSILLRGFDREYSETIGKFMEMGGTKFNYGSTPSKIVKTADGRLEVTWAGKGGEAKDVYDTVVCAIGRFADTPKLGVANADIKITDKGQIICTNEQTSTPNIYALGDVVLDVPTLTPVAIASGKLLAKRLFGGATEAFNYDLVPTTVFTPIEYGCIGLSEEDAIEKYGAINLEIYHREVAPLEWALTAKPKEISRLKLICHKGENLRVIGFHFLGPDAGEVTQGFAVAMKLGATYKDFTETVGIHPTNAEDFTTVSVTKASGESVKAGGC